MGSKKERIVWIDQLRSIAFLFVIIGHVALPKETKSLIYSFHMPLFFLISGLTVSREKLMSIPIKEYIIKQVKSLIIPYFWISFLCYPLWYFAYHILIDTTKLTVYGAFKGILAGSLQYTSTSNALWFLLVLFVANILYALLLKITKGNEAVLLALVLLCGVFGFLEKAIPQLWHFNVAFTAVVLLYIGNRFMMYYKSSKFFNRKETSFYALKVIGLIVASTLIGLQSHKLNGRISMTANKFGKSIFLFYLTALAFSFAITLIMMHVPKLSVITYIGQNTLLYLGIHIPIIRIFEKAYPNIFLEYRYSIPFAFVLFFALIPIVALCNKLFPYVCGKPTQKPTPIQNIAKVVMVVWCTAIPFAYVLAKFGLFSYEIPHLILILAVLVVLSVAFVLVTNRFIPEIYLENRNKKPIK